MVAVAPIDSSNQLRILSPSRRRCHDRFMFTERRTWENPRSPMPSSRWFEQSQRFRGAPPRTLILSVTSTYTLMWFQVAAGYSIAQPPHNQA